MAKFTRAEIRKIIGEACTEEMENQLVALHIGIVDPLKDDLTKYKVDADKLQDIQNELDTLKSKGDGGYKEKYETEHREFESYKSSVAAAKTTAAKEKAVESALRKVGVSDKRVQAVARLAKGDGLLDKLELDENGAVKDSEALEKSLKDAYSDYIPTTKTKGANTATPPANNGGKVLTREDIYKTDDKGRYVMSTAERQQALAELMANENE